MKEDGSSVSYDIIGNITGRDVWTFLLTFFRGNTMDNKRATHDNKVISFIPNGEFYYEKAVQAMQRERFEDAHKYLKRAAELSPNDPLILMQYGVLVMEEGLFEDAHELLIAAHALDPLEKEIIFYLAEVHAHLGLLRDAKAYAKKYMHLIRLVICRRVNGDYRFLGAGRSLLR